MRRQRICTAGQPPNPLSKQFKTEAGIAGPASGSAAVAAAGIGKSLPGKWALTLSAGSGNEFADAAGRVGVAIGSLWSETLVVVIVAVDDHIRVGFIESLSQRLNLWIIAVGRSRN